MNYEQQFYLKDQIANYLEDTETYPGKIINLIILGLILLSFIIFVAETYSLPKYLEVWFYYIDIVILISFTIEYFIRFWCAKAKLKFLFSLFSILDILAIVPSLFGFIDVSFFRVFRWFRILRMIRFIDFETSLFKIKIANEIAITRIFLILLSITFVYSGLIYQIEHQHNPQVFRNFFDALYFSVVTMTTVGFGDVTPLSELGRAMTLIMILTGIVFIPWQITELTRQLMTTVENKNETPSLTTGFKDNITCSNCGLDSHDNDAIFCKKCGSKLDLAG